MPRWSVLKVSPAGIHTILQQAQFSRTIPHYYSTLIDEDKDRILNQFVAASSPTRALISSKALAHGKDVDIVMIRHSIHIP